MEYKFVPAEIDYWISGDTIFVKVLSLYLYRLGCLVLIINLSEKFRQYGGLAGGYFRDQLILFKRRLWSR